MCSNSTVARIKMDHELVPRSHDDYTMIDKFEKYEFTHCITYELARRNSYVENSLNLLFELFSHFNQCIVPILSIYEKAVKIDDDDILKEINDAENIYKEIFRDLLNKYNIHGFADHFENLNFENIKEKISYLVENITQKLYDQYYIIYQPEPGCSSSDFNEIYSSLTYLERDEALTEYINNLYENGIVDDDGYRYNYADNKYFTVYQSIDKNQKNFSFSTIYPNFRTAMRDFTDTKIVLNLNLPIDEINDYVEKIKKDYDSKNSIIKTPRQLLEEKLEINDHDVGIKNSEKWADLFFIYDYYHYCEAHTSKKVYEIQREIQIELTKHHGLEIGKDIIPWEDYLKDNPDINEENIDSDGTVKLYLSTKSIINKYKEIKAYIEGENPKYKTLLNRFAL